jgi:hypothetical protein
MCPDDSLAGFLDALVLTDLRHTISKEQQDEAAVQKVNAEQIGHEGQLGISGEDDLDSFGRKYAVAGAFHEFDAGDPIGN